MNKKETNPAALILKYNFSSILQQAKDFILIKHDLQFNYPDYPSVS